MDEDWGDWWWVDGDDFDEEANDEMAAELNAMEEDYDFLEKEYGVPVEGDD